MASGKHDDLLEQKSKWEELIQQTNLAQKKLLDLMIQLRKELSSLSQLKKDYPESVEITNRINQCDKLLEQSSETVDGIKKELAGFKKQKDALEQVIKQCNEPTISGSTGLKI